MRETVVSWNRVVAGLQPLRNWSRRWRCSLGLSFNGVVVVGIACILSCGGATPAEPEEDSTVPAVPLDDEACVRLLERPEDVTEKGPWPVGTRRVTLERPDGVALQLDVFYPAARSSPSSAPRAEFDIRQFLPPSQQGQVPDARAPVQVCDCVRDLEPDTDHGPYPAIVVVHGTASFSTQSLSDVTHWASRGFVVLAATHPGLYLGDQLSLFCPDDPSGSRDVIGDVRLIVDAVRAAGAGPLAFVARPPSLALIGHSAGANTVVQAASELTPSEDAPVKVVVSLSGNAASEAEVSFLALAGTADRVVQASASEAAFDASGTPRRYVALENAGHLAFSDLCETRNDDGNNLLVIAQDEGVCGAELAGLLFDCDPAQQEAALSRAIVRAATSWVLEEALHCTRHSRSFLETLGALEGVAASREDLAPSSDVE